MLGFFVLSGIAVIASHQKIAGWHPDHTGGGVWVYVSTATAIVVGSPYTYIE